MYSKILQGITEANLLPFLWKYRRLRASHRPPFCIHTVVRCSNHCGLSRISSLHQPRKRGSPANFSARGTNILLYGSAGKRSLVYRS